eukprot:m.16939 g.16939  ORF g.16939 m.16939 type:complete len:247 (-) comp3551_c0_seq2:24-764(-)
MSRRSRTMLWYAMRMQLKDAVLLCAVCIISTFALIVPAAQAHPTLHPVKDYPAYEDLDVHAFDAEEPFSAVFVFEQPDDWGEALQILTDILRSTGTVGGKDCSEQIIPLYSGNPDLEYGAVHNVARLTNGAFISCLAHIYERVTGRALKVEFSGKPYAAVYQYAERTLLEQNPDIEHIYMIGDNPKSDIRGGNAAGGRWRTVLVRTGCFKGEDNDPTDPANYVVRDVAEALATIARLEKFSDWEPL